MNRNVVVVQEFMASYRVEFYSILRESLSGYGVRLSVIHGEAGGREAFADETTLPWMTKTRVQRFPIAGKSLVWMAPPLDRRPDLIIVEHASRHILNYLLVVGAKYGRVPLAFWGHGANLQGTSGRSSEWIKRRMSKHANWWFAYTSSSAMRVAAAGFPIERITIVNNSTRVVEPTEPVMDSVGLRVAFVGSLHKHKRLGFLFASLDDVHNRLPGLTAVLVGDGPLRDAAVNYAARRPWCSYLGRLEGASKSDALGRADLFLNPGLVGLGAIDSFVCRTPMVTISGPAHSPEFDYLVNEHNSVILPEGSSPAAYGRSVAELLGDRARLGVLRAGCQESAAHYTVELMAHRFASGILAAVGAP